MELQKNVSYHQKLKRLGHQLALSEHVLYAHPSLKGQMTILQTLVHYFNLQMQWTLAGRSARLLLTFQAALHAQEKQKSQTGFIGPTLHRLQQFISRLIELSLSSSEKDRASLMATFIQIVTVATIYIATHLLEQGKRLIPQDDPFAAQKASFLLRELGLTFVLGSKITQSAFVSVCQGLHLKESSQKKVTDIGMAFLLILLMLSPEQEASDENEWMEMFQRFIRPGLESIKSALHEGEGENVFEKEHLSFALSQLQVIQQALDAGEMETLKQALTTIFDLFDISHEKVKEDLKQLSLFCAQLDNSFNNIYRTERTATTVQAA